MTVDSKSEKDSEGEQIPCFCSQRWGLAYIGFFAFVFVYAVRVNFSVALVCMVKTENVNTTFENGNGTVESTDGCNGPTETDPQVYEHAEFTWDKTVRSTMLSAFFYGYIVTQIPGGWAADRYGGKRVFGIAMVIAVICTVLMPVFARTSIVLVYASRIILGLATAVSFPAMNSMWGRWAPPLERSKLVSFTYLGTTLGFVSSFTLSGLLCEYGFDNGWGSIFYVFGIATFLWVCCWFFFTSDSPENNRFISSSEKKYILSRIEYDTSQRASPQNPTTQVQTTNNIPPQTAAVPYKDMVKSKALWACLVAHCCNNWTNYTLLTSLPDFMKSVLRFDIKSNGLLSSIPYICQAVFGFIAGQLADYLRSREILSTTATRKIFQLIAFLGAGACMVVVGFFTCHTKTLAVVFLALAVAFTGIGRVGYPVNHIDFAPKYAGILFGITNTFATIPGMVAPIVAGALTPNDTAEEWRYVFFVCAALDLFGAVVFGVFASGTIETWAMDSVDDTEIDIPVRVSKDTQNDS